MEKFYKSMLNIIHHNYHLKKLIIFINQYFPLIMYTLYPILLVYLLITQSSLFMRVLIKPLSAFLFVTVIRKLINRPRPYDTMTIDPLISHKSGQSFPSRHTVSAMIIALVCFDIHFGLGLFVLIIAIMISLSRILAGVHYISDVIVAMIIAFLINLLKIF